jgi:serine/threonine-protein kinase RsbT
MTAETRVEITSDLDLVLARAEGRTIALELGFGRTEATLIATAISEIARNIVVHGRRGEVIITPVSDGRRSGLQVIAADDGPGIPDVELALTDGFATRGGLGLGLPGARRLMDDFHIESVMRQGTTVTMCKWCDGHR